MGVSATLPELSEWTLKWGLATITLCDLLAAILFKLHEPF